MKTKWGSERLKEVGWQTNGIYWWFEDSGQMSFQDALAFHKEAMKEDKITDGKEMG